jgi:hypothetical protein
VPRTAHFGSKLLDAGESSFARPKKPKRAGAGAKTKEVAPGRGDLFFTNQAAEGCRGDGDGRLADSTVRPHSMSSTSYWCISTIHWFRVFAPVFRSCASQADSSAGTAGFLVSTPDDVSL